MIRLQHASLWFVASFVAIFALPSSVLAQPETTNAPPKTQAKTKSPTKKATARPTGPPVPPTHADVAYGDHPRQVLDFYQAKSLTPTPLVVFIHGGGWVNGDKWGAGSANIARLRKEGISVAAINYRFVTQGRPRGSSRP